MAHTNHAHAIGERKRHTCGVSYREDRDVSFFSNFYSCSCFSLAESLTGYSFQYFFFLLRVYFLFSFIFLYLFILNLTRYYYFDFFNSHLYIMDTIFILPTAGYLYSRF